MPGATILIVDDDEKFRRSVEKELVRAGYRVVVAARPDEAQELLTSSRPDLAILDLEMPAWGEESSERAGIDLLEDIKEQSPATQVIMLTGRNSADPAVEAMKLGACDYMVKGKLSRRALLDAVEKALSSKPCPPPLEAGGPDLAVEFDLAGIRNLLRAAYSARGLRRFCYDRPAFRDVIRDFGPNSGLDDRIDAVLEYCEKRNLVAKLLSEIEKDNPEQFRIHQANLHRTGTSATA
jgi:CheY-like chemotaxis protein